MSAEARTPTRDPLPSERPARPAGHPTRDALRMLDTVAMAMELALSEMARR